MKNYWIKEKINRSELLVCHSSHLWDMIDDFKKIDVDWGKPPEISCTVSIKCPKPFDHVGLALAKTDGWELDL